MIFFETSTGQYLRPVHLLLMLYRYLSGVYQLGDVSALNYVKGFLDGHACSVKLERILTISGHGIGEPELWLSDRLPNCQIDTVSFRLVDTQLMQFLRSAGPRDVEEVFAQFQQVVAPLTSLAELVTDQGLVPYWQSQVTRWSELHRSNVNVYSDHPLRIPQAHRYDLIYVSHGLRHLSADALTKLRGHLNPGSWLAVLVPAVSRCGNERFADSPLMDDAKSLFNQALAQRGYPPVQHKSHPFDLAGLTSKRERIQFSVPAPANAVLVGELLLYSMYEHLSDRIRLEVLNETLGRFAAADMAVEEVLELFMIEGGSCDN